MSDETERAGTAKELLEDANVVREATPLRLELLEKTRIPSISIRIMSEVLDEEGLDAEVALAEAGLSRPILSDPHVLISGLQELAFQRAFTNRTANRPDLWVKTGRRYRWLHYGIGGLAATTAPTLHDLVLSMPEWLYLTYTLNSLEILTQDRLHIGLEFDLTEVPHMMRQFTVYRDIGASVTFFADVLSLAGEFLQIKVAFPDPGLPNLSALLGGARVDFNAERSGYVWGPELARRPLPNADPMLHAVYLNQCRELAASIVNSGSFLELVVKSLMRSDQPQTMEAVAHDLHVSKRTLQRRLQDHGMSFHDVRGRILARRALEMLRTTDMPISEIAWNVGYTDPTGFSHAFRRWTGLSPRAFRDHHEQE